MRRSDMAGQGTKFMVTGAAVLLALAGCSAKATDTDSNPMGATGAGTNAIGNAGSVASAMSGSGAMVSGSSGTGSTNPQAGNGGDVTGPQAGSGEMTTAGSGSDTAGSGEMTTAGSGDENPPASACDNSAFLTDCQQGGASWGTDQQFGPCKSGVSVYGVHTEYGPYGASSKYNVGSGANGSDFTAAFPIGTCSTFIDGFGADPKGSADLKDVHDLDFDKFTVFYPGCMPEGEKFPLITWGNGTCAMPEGYGPLLRYVASFGYIIIAPNDLATGVGASMLKGLDFMLAENDNSSSEFYQHIDADKIGAMGHSQGAGATVSAASDPRIKAIIAWNSGSSPDKPFLNVSGDRDIGGTVSGNKNDTEGKQVPGAWLWYHQIPQNVMGSTTGETAPGHLTLMMEPERVSDVAVAWWDMMLKGKPEAKAMFLGDDCTLCKPDAFTSMWPPARSDSDSTPSLEYGHNTLLQ